MRINSLLLPLLFAPAARAAMAPFLGSNAADGFALKLFPAGTTALCLDGSVAGYYVRPGRGAGATTFLLELEGGGWCSSNDDCLSRSKTDIGSSKAWPAAGCPGMDGGSNGLFSNDCSVNPDFCNATMVHANYCDGASFAGHRDEAINAAGVDIFFRGRDILDATLAAMLESEGLASATALVAKGCSAGGLATILNVDRIAEVVRTAVPGIAVVGLPDAGYFLDHNNTVGAPTWTPLYQWVSSAQNVTPSLDAGCVQHYTPLGEEWRCFMAQYAAPFVSTPSFFAQDLTDSWQLTNIYQLPCSPYHGHGDCTPAQLALVDEYYTSTFAALAPVFASPVHGGFITACVQHCHSNIDFCFDSEIVEGQSMRETFGAWFANTTRGVAVPPGVKTMVVDARGLANPTCTSSCSPY